MKNSGSGPKKAISPIPEDFRCASARLAIERGSRSYPLPSDGSTTSHCMKMVASSIKGSRLAVEGSGNNNMSEASIPFHPATEEPSNACPSSNLSISKLEAGTLTCCSFPRVSVKRRSTNLASFSLIIFKTSSAVLDILFSLVNSSLLAFYPCRFTNLIPEKHFPCQILFLYQRPSCPEGTNESHERNEHAP